MYIYRLYTYLTSITYRNSQQVQKNPQTPPTNGNTKHLGSEEMTATLQVGRKLRQGQKIAFIGTRKGGKGYENS